MCCSYTLNLSLRKVSEISILNFQFISMYVASDGLCH